MFLCDDGHNEVCYEVRDCPVCLLSDEKDAFVEDLANQIAELKVELEKEE